MPIPLTIRERIERRIASLVSGGNFTVERFDKDGNAVTHRSATVVAGDEQVTEGGIGTGGLTEVELPVVIAVVIARPENGEPTSTTHTRILGELEALLLADPEVTDDQAGERLAIDMRKSATYANALEEGQPEAVSILEITVHFHHTRNDPYTAPGVARLEV